MQGWSTAKNGQAGGERKVLFQVLSKLLDLPVCGGIGHWFPRPCLSSYLIGVCVDASLSVHVCIYVCVTFSVPKCIRNNWFPVQCLIHLRDPGSPPPPLYLFLCSPPFFSCLPSLGIFTVCSVLDAEYAKTDEEDNFSTCRELTY